ncbi:DUF5412 family protein [Gorillibacterium sp. sgz500922]|uniref:DUF5412 family protein n=1 Tax=Gorillibacterium sp. sgz500922 TaxID=3446694 RepID=UPI003F673F8D
MNESRFAIGLLFSYALALLGLICLPFLLAQIVKRKKRNDRRFPVLLALVSFVPLLVSACFVLSYALTLVNLPAGILNHAYRSPDRSLTIRTYHYTGYWYDKAKAVLVDNKSGKRKTVYYNAKDYSPKVEWMDESRVRIGRVTLNLAKGETFDYRKSGESTVLPDQNP